MSRQKRKKTNVKKNAQKILIFIGKPFFKIFHFIAALVILFLYVVGHIARVSAEKIFEIPKHIHKHSERIVYLAKDLKLKKILTKKSRKIRKFSLKFLTRKLPKKLLSFKIFFFKIVRSKLKLFTFIAGILILFIFIIWFFIFRGLPSPKELLTRKVNVSTKIYDRNGVLLYQIYKDQNRTPVNLNAIPNIVKAATLASEDADFYTNPGFSVKGIIRAILADIGNKGFAAGGSTITQQLVKNTLLTSQKTITRKIKELVLSLEVEQSYSKDSILEMYLNEVSYGGSAYGIEAASEQYFGKPVDKLDLAQAALLAGLPRSPTNYSPFGANPDLAFERQKEVLQLMTDNGFITKTEMKAAENEKITFAPDTIDIKAPHFVMYVKQKLVDQYGEEAVESGGLNVITTLDYNIQKMAETAVSEQVAKLAGLHVTNGAAMVIDPGTGEILAMVGSKDYFDIANDGNVNVITALRPPGSSIKIVNYAYALSHGYTPATMIKDEPTTFKAPGTTPYTPVNYDGKFVGEITLRDALAQSRNIPAVKVLASYGVSHMIELGQNMGITTWKDPSLYGLSLTLGGGATRLIDLARVFATVADYGSRPPLVSIKSVADYKGNKLDAACDTDTCDPETVLDPRVAYQLISILSDNNARSPEFGSHSSLFVPGHPEVAVKTGTSNDLRDNLTIGFNQKYLTAVWVGNNDNSPMNRIASGITGAAPIWNEIMAHLLANNDPVAWAPPDGIFKTSCLGQSEWFLDGTNTKPLCEIKISTPSAQVVNH